MEMDFELKEQFVLGTAILAVIFLSVGSTIALALRNWPMVVFSFFIGLALYFVARILDLLFAD